MLETQRRRRPVACARTVASTGRTGSDARADPGRPRPAARRGAVPGRRPACRVAGSCSRRRPDAPRRRAGGPPAAPPHPGRHDRPARRGRSDEPTTRAFDGAAAWCCGCRPLAAVGHLPAGHDRWRGRRTAPTRSSAVACSPRTRTCASAGGPARCRPRSSRRRSRRRRPHANATRASKAATYTYDPAGANPIGYGPGATCGVNGLACFTRSAPTGFTMWLREQGHVFDWGTLKWCQAYSSPPNGCYDAETIALDEFGHVEGLEPPRQLRRRFRLPRRGRPDLLADEAVGRLEHARVRALRRRVPPAPVRHADLEPRSTRPASIWPPI